MTEMKELIGLIVRSLVDGPDQVSVEAIEESDRTTFELRVASEDLGKVIGKQGRTARSIRTLLDSAGDKQGTRFVLDILE
jgi:predicted RNA-binding protein YlqC (UPF0109 family)